MNKELLNKLGITDESITDDKLVELVLGERNKLKADNDKQKEIISKRNSEIAEFKRVADEKKTDEEKHNEYVAKLESDLAEMKRKNTANEIKSKYLALGYSDEEADKIASASIDSNFSLIAKYVGEHQEKVKAELKAEMLKNTPKPNGGGSGTDPKEYYTKENFRKGKIKYDDLCKLQVENKALFDEITSK